MAKEVINKLKLVIPAGKANPAPPIGPILGQNGIPIQPFCQEFNEKTAQMGNVEVPVVVTVFKDRSYKMTIFKPTVVSLLKNKLKFSKGSGTPNKVKVGKIKKSELVEIAEEKMPDLNTRNLDSAINTVAGVAKSLGIEVTE